MTNLSVEPNPRVTYRTHFEDDHLLVVEKRSGLVTQPGVGHTTDTLLNGLFDAYGPRLQNLGQPRDFGLVHRLDRDTSGLLAVALTAAAYDGLRAAFEQREVRKFYWAVCKSAPREPEGVIRLSLDERIQRIDRYTSVRRGTISKSGKPALTAYRVLEANDLGALIEARPVTGRLHQIRLHLNAIGATVLGDPLYGGEAARASAPRLALHAHRLAFTHPITGERIDAQSRWPGDLRLLLKKHELSRPDLADADDTQDSDADDAGHEPARDAIRDEPR